MYMSEIDVLRFDYCSQPFSTLLRNSGFSAYYFI